MPENELSLSLRAQAALQARGFHFTHSLGQNFILDDQVISDIVSAAGVNAGDNILEIGPGAGIMTAMMADRGANVLALELDHALEGVLQEIIGDRSAKVVFQDAMKADIDKITDEAFGKNAPTCLITLPQIF